MSQNCDCNDLSNLTARTGLATLLVANPTLDGTTGVIYPVLAAAPSGSVVKSITIKSSIAVTAQGTVRFFIQNAACKALFYEVYIPISPTAVTTQIPAEVQELYVAYIPCNIQLQGGDILCATTQNAGSFNIFAEGLDISYPQQTPASCCNFKEQYPNTGAGIISVANPHTDGSGEKVIVFTADNSYEGTLITSIYISSLQSTSEGMLRLYITSDGVDFRLFNEIRVPQSVVSSVQPSFSIKLPQQFNLEAGFAIAASTEKAEKFAVRISGTKWKYAV